MIRKKKICKKNIELLLSSPCSPNNKVILNIILKLTLSSIQLYNLMNSKTVFERLFLQFCAIVDELEVVMLSELFMKK